MKKKDNVERYIAAEIEAFFKDLSPRNEVTILDNSQETDKVLWEIQQNKQTEEKLKRKERGIRHKEIELSRQRERLEKELGIFHLSSDIEFDSYQLEPSLNEIKQEESKLKHELDTLVDAVAKLKEQIERDNEKVKKLQSNTRRAVSTAMDKWIHNQGNRTLLIYTM